MVQILLQNKIGQSPMAISAWVAANATYSKWEYCRELKLPDNTEDLQLREHRENEASLTMGVPIEHHTTVHGIDWVQPTGHEPIVHENNCALCRPYTLPVDNRAPTNRTPRRLCTTDGVRFNCTQIRLCTILTEHSVRSENGAPVICAPYRLCTSD